MKKFYFTYGMDSDKQAYKKGWSVVYAADVHEAISVFLLVHPLVDGMIPCAFYYTAEDFEGSECYRQGNGGRYAHEVISLDVKRYSREDWIYY